MKKMTVMSGVQDWGKRTGRQECISATELGGRHQSMGKEEQGDCDKDLRSRSRKGEEDEEKGVAKYNKHVSTDDLLDGSYKKRR
jgi:hypothetical protein